MMIFKNDFYKFHFRLNDINTNYYIVRQYLKIFFYNLHSSL